MPWASCLSEPTFLRGRHCCTASWQRDTLHLWISASLGLMQVVLRFWQFEMLQRRFAEADGLCAVWSVNSIHIRHYAIRGSGSVSFVSISRHCCYSTSQCVPWPAQLVVCHHVLQQPWGTWAGMGC
jgi:hypothetical protein